MKLYLDEVVFLKRKDTVSALMEPVWAEDVIQAIADMHTVMNYGRYPEKSAQGAEGTPQRSPQKQAGHHRREAK